MFTSPRLGLGLGLGLRCRVQWYAVGVREGFGDMPWKMPWKVLPLVVPRHVLEKDQNVYPPRGGLPPAGNSAHARDG